MEAISSREKHMRFQWLEYGHRARFGFGDKALSLFLRIMALSRLIIMKRNSSMKGWNSGTLFILVILTVSVLW